MLYCQLSKFKKTRVEVSKKVKQKFVFLYKRSPRQLFVYFHVCLKFCKIAESVTISSSTSVDRIVRGNVKLLVKDRSVYSRKGQDGCCWSSASPLASYQGRRAFVPSKPEPKHLTCYSRWRNKSPCREQCLLTGRNKLRQKLNATCVEVLWSYDVSDLIDTLSALSRFDLDGGFDATKLMR